MKGRKLNVHHLPEMVTSPHFQDFISSSLDHLQYTNAPPPLFFSLIPNPFTTTIVACSTNNALFVLQATIHVAAMEGWVQG